MVSPANLCFYFLTFKHVEEIGYYQHSMGESKKFGEIFGDQIKQLHFKSNLKLGLLE